MRKGLLNRRSIRALFLVVLALFPVIRALFPVIRALFPVIRAKAGGHKSPGFPHQVRERQRGVRGGQKEVCGKT
ncbi:MAG: hypothetical protein BGO28_04655 [Alphaproteobacteria bacterium 43-37]|nr:MAG: hypothetical protein BGO28_04655 [Alphaproteobacteria bacterium 43-37]